MTGTVNVGNPALTAHLVAHPDDVAKVVAGHLSKPMPEHVYFAILGDMAAITDTPAAPSALKATGLRGVKFRDELRRRLAA